MRERLLEIFDRLLAAFGRRNWWPGETPLEVMVGTVLTQNTSWKNVEKAIGNMKAEGILDLAKLQGIEAARLSQIIVPAGYYNVKSRRLLNLVNTIVQISDSCIDNLKIFETDELRRILLDVNGVGPETADSILLYALERPVFVIDAYTKRFVRNHRLYPTNGDYHELQHFFMENLPRDTYLFNEYHALIVCLCQRYCGKKPSCAECPLNGEGEFF